MLIRRPGIFIFAVMASLLSGCASNSVLTLMDASKHGDIVVPNAGVIEQEFKGRAFRAGKTALDAGAAVRLPAGYADGFFRTLIQRQVEKGFRDAMLESGNAPASTVDIVVEEMKFTQGRFLIPDPSVLRVRIEVRNADGRTLMRGEMESRYHPTVPIAVGGVMSVVAIGGEGQEWVAAGKMIPAVAVAITRTMAGLQSGKALGEIEIYPESLAAGSVIMPDLFLRDSPYGLAQLTKSELQNASQGE